MQQPEEGDVTFRVEAFRFRVERAKTGRGRCSAKRCRLAIDAGELRFGEPYWPRGCSSNDDAHVAHHWYHLKCAQHFLDQYPDQLTTSDDLHGFEDLEEDMKTIVRDWFECQTLPCDHPGKREVAESWNEWPCQICTRATSPPRLYVVHYKESCGECPSHKTHLPSDDDERELRLRSKITCNLPACRHTAIGALERDATPMVNITTCPKCKVPYTLSRVEVKEIARSREKVCRPFLLAHGMALPALPPTTPKRRARSITNTRKKKGTS